MRAAIVAILSICGALLMAGLVAAPARAQTPTPWPTPDATSVFSGTLPTGPGAGGGGGGGGGGPGISAPITIPLPAPIPLEPITQTIDFAPLWDANNFTGMASAVLTVFNLQNIPEFLSIFLPVMGMVIGLRLLVAFVSNRRNSGSEEV